MEFYVFDHIVAILFGIVFPVMAVSSGDVDDTILEQLPPKKHLFYTNALTLVIGALIVITSWNFAHRPWEDMGFRPPQISTSVLILIVTILLIYGIDIFYGLMNSESQKQKIKQLSYMIPLDWNEFRPFVMMSAAAGICEEIIYRGFLVTYMYNIIPFSEYSGYLGAAIPSVSFAISHMNQGFWSVIKIFLIGVLLGLIYLESGSLWIVICLHVAIDIISGMVTVLSKNTWED